MAIARKGTETGL